MASILQPIYQTMENDGADAYFSEEFRIVLEKHLPLMVAGQNAYDIPVQADVAFKHEYNFWGLLTELGIPPYLHWFVMRLNNLASPEDYRKDMLLVSFPDLNYLDRLRQRHKTIHTIV